jgi:hypothetical protein
MQLGPELFALLNAKQRVGNMKPVVYGQGGLSDQELDRIEGQLGFALPPDFRYLLGNIKDEGNVFFPWAKFDLAEYQRRVDQVLEGILFDVEKCGDWADCLGERPSPPSAAAERARREFPKWPKLLPIYSHRFLPAHPCEPGNPVFSIVQTDIIYYGANLAHYLMNEFLERDRNAPWPEIRPIAAWSDWVLQGWGQG